MKMNLRFALVGAAALVAAPIWAEEPGLQGRDNAESAEAAAVAPVATSAGTSAAGTTSRGEPIVTPETSETVPAPAPRRSAPRPAAQTASPDESGSIARSIVADVQRETSHIVVTVDTAPAYYRYTRATQFIDEQGQVLSADAVKSGVNATLHYTRSEGDLVLTKVIVNSPFRPLAARQSDSLTEVQFDR